MEFQELFNKVDTFNNDHSLTSVIKSNTVPEFNKKDYRGNQYEMDQFNWKMQYIDYKKATLRLLIPLVVLVLSHILL